MRLFVHRDESSWGPFELRDLPEMLAEGRLAPEDPARWENDDNWYPLRDLVELPSASVELEPQVAPVSGSQESKVRFITAPATPTSVRPLRKRWKGRLVGWLVVLGLGVTPLVLGVRAWSGVGEVYATGQEQTYKLPFEGGINGYWRGEKSSL